MVMIYFPILDFQFNYTEKGKTKILKLILTFIGDIIYLEIFFQINLYTYYRGTGSACSLFVNL